MSALLFSTFLALLVPGAASPSEHVMIRIEPGTFLMGSPAEEAGRDDDEAQHQVTLTRAFWLGKYEVTQRQWQEVMGENPSKSRGLEQPVEQVSWTQCLQFCNALSQAEGLTPAYVVLGDSVSWDRQANGYRLPTEAEWEFACRAGTTGPFTGDLDEVAIYARNSLRETREVGGRPANPWGLHDMHGNVWEWCWDYWAPYQDGPATDPTGAISGTHRTERGGSWHRKPRDLRCASRSANWPHTKRSGTGLRLARWCD